MLTLVLFDSDFASSTLSTMGTVFTAFSPYTGLVLGVLLAIGLVAIAIRAIIHR